MKYVLEIENVSKLFFGLVAIDDLTIKVKPGQIYGIIGPNGAGKTTLFNCVTGIYKPEKGTIKYKGEDITGMPAHKIAQKGVLRTFQNIRLFKEMSVAENIMAGCHTKSKQKWYHSIIHTPFYKKDNDKSWKKVEELMDFFNLTKFAMIPTGDLSYGNQRKVEMARALAAEPELLILDEPAAGLNENETIELTNIILKIKEMGLGIMMIEHDMDMVMKLTDYITVINFGKEISQGEPDFVQDDPRVIEAYIGSDDDEDEE
ncbi:ABC transporter ATP-binding protein [Malaciobacter marinus]|uniref:ABC transporter ATP-binding protein n=1 Tax=Malaciobacter marinus TaxID=505249 RepID=A0A347TKS1_9BACT|nr:MULTISPECIES: ABC transporter ATP-binding protein [Malaciobacter]AXX87199.1 high-affinity branched-chain amino acid ABC transporter, ATP-binding protein [Malaciobacter marinus]PHO12712.1 ABC transporter ATP-binding protein [Malaciobacter marinus]PHO14861.1 ABC transporter ATP-binding protein [Malaciobacter marinus]RYA22994.1 ABC transporter ATP-binding protein [Malaciobacter halophilus]